jgi:hypothetical protein
MRLNDARGLTETHQEVQVSWDELSHHFDDIDIHNLDQDENN